MQIRWFVYDITTVMEDFVASFADVEDAKKFGREKFGDNAWVTTTAHHDKLKAKQPSWLKPRKETRKRHW